MPLFRLRYNGSASTWGFAIDRAGHNDHENAYLPIGHPSGGPQEALDCATVPVPAAGPIAREPAASAPTQRIDDVPTRRTSPGR